MSKRLNRAKCKLCGDIIVSRSVHDFVSCKCHEIYIDGGNDYWRQGAKNPNNILRYRNRQWQGEVGGGTIKKNIFQRVLEILRRKI